jgi:hypothetical protein
MTDRRPTTLRANLLRAQLLAARGGKCEDCGHTFKLQFAHLKPTGLSGRGRGKWQRMRDVKKHPDAYRLLCWKCHLALDLKVDARAVYAEALATSTAADECPF